MQVRKYLNEMCYFDIIDLESFLKYVTGSKMLPAGCISVDIEESSTTVFSSTCLVRLSIPSALQEMDEQAFAHTIHAAIRKEGDAFNSI